MWSALFFDKVDQSQSHKIRKKLKVILKSLWSQFMTLTSEQCFGWSWGLNSGPWAFLQASLDCDRPTYNFHVAEITGMFTMPGLLVELRSPCFLPRLTSNCDGPVSSFQVSGIPSFI
jgi:hypothetical protein